MVSADGVITTVAGNGIAGSLGDGGPASSAQLLLPSAVALDSSGNLYIAEAGGQRIRKVSPDGTIVTVAGNGHFGYSGDGGPATSAMLDQPEGVALDASGNLYIADSFNQRIRKVGTDGVITTVAGTGVKGYSGDGGPATSALLWIPNGVVVDASGNLYIADEYNQRVRRVGPDGAITTIAGDGTIGYYGDGGPATSALIGFLYGIAVDGSGNFFFSNGLDWRVSEVSSTSVIRTVAGNGTPGNSGDGGNATSAQLDPHTVSLDVSGNLYISDTSANCVRKVSLDGTITTVAGNGNAGYSGDGGQAINARLNDPAGLAVDPSGNLYIGDALNYRVRKIATDGTITTFAGTGVSGFSGDGGSAVNARLTIPGSLAADDAGNVFIADGTRVRRVSSDGIIRTVAGNGTSADSGDGGPATQAALNTPSGIAVDSSGNLFIAETRGERIRVVSAGTGIINTIAGNGTSGYSGDGGPAISAQLNSPDGLAVDSSGNIYVTDFWNRVIRLLQPVTGLTTSSTQTISSAHPKSLP